MARRRAEKLGVWLEGRRVADLEQTRWPAIACRYREEALESWPANTPVISCSLPLGRKPQDALAFCRGLLPEGRALETLAGQAGLASNDTFRLLARYGRDVAGALIISAEAPDSSRFDVEPYTPDGLAEAIDDLEEHPLGAHDDSELSLAGLQDKLLLVKLDDGGWGRPLRGRPSTHILKLESRSYAGLIPAEAECLSLARAAELTTIESHVEEFNEISCLIVSRFDRREVDGEVERVHQEDLCQAMAIDPGRVRGRGKYENAGGPGFLHLAGLLDTYAADPPAELKRLVSVVTFTALTGNADAHGKNVALLHPSAERVTLAPLYDTVPTALWPKLRTAAAMSIGGRLELPRVTLGDIVREATMWSFPAELARETAIETIRAVVEATEDGTVASDSRVAAFVRARANELIASSG